MNLIEIFKQAEKKKKMMFLATAAAAVIAVVIVFAVIVNLIANSPDRKIQRASDYAINGQYQAALNVLNDMTGEDVYVLRAYCNLKIKAEENVNSCVTLQECSDGYNKLQQYITDIQEYRIYLNDVLYSEVERILDLTGELTFSESNAFSDYMFKACSVLEIIQNMKDGEYFTAKDNREKIDACKTALGNAEEKYRDITGNELRTVYASEIGEIEECYEFVLKEMDEAEAEFGETDSVHYTKTGAFFDPFRYYFDENTAGEVTNEATAAEYTEYFKAVSNY